MTRLFNIFFFFFFALVHAQITEVNKEINRIQISFPDSAQGWQRTTNAQLLLNQSLYENWQSGGVNNIELKSKIQSNFNYKNQDLIWDNRLVMDYAMNKVNGFEFRKTFDKTEINSLVGGKLPGNWSYSYFINLQTGLTNTYNYEKDLTKENRTSGFLAPLYITTGPGLMWRSSDLLYFNMAPVTAKSIYINGRVHRYNEALDTFVSSDEVEMYGVLPGEYFRHKIGFYSSAYFKFQLSENIHVENTLSLYSNYLDKPENIDLDYLMNISMEINKLLSTQVMLRLRYDDEEFPGLQSQETFGVGLNFDI